MSQVHRVPVSPLKQWWLKWRFHLNILLILIPLGFMPKYFADAKLLRGDAGLGVNPISAIQVGPYTVDLAELRNEAPRADGPAGHFKAFNAALCKACIGDAKAIYLRIGKPRNLRAAGSIFFGAPYRMSTNLPVPARTRPDARIWITLEGWDGSMHQGSVALADASPATVAWLKKQGGKP
ncbi:thiamine pyrophosphate-binding protein [Pseudomonas taiwanensis]|uniref:Thiamine pyrophosphate-binding protein n=1 Tax=Pseudomonas taiwanensis TaxID=470150 RepID=A0ABR6V195_9PSED|nr:thiamine pyrophosphate-binding protein [Pseudomonas taiwanensis]MBC3474204.1 thiamine pyrophosphate-binding protein [Pseudomonas taiwanensis]MBC3492357.1 thiamine pyrophosphate-binding protein [Pseudomonas taiwanensis]